MGRIDRRTFLAGLTGSLVAASAMRLSGATLLFPWQQVEKPQSGYPGMQAAPMPAGRTCWLNVNAPFIVEDPKLGLTTEILLTATCFPGAEGFRDAGYGTEYQVELFDASGKEIKLGSAAHIVIPAMRPTVLRMAELVGKKKFWGGARIRLAPSGKQQVTHPGDLFSAGFVRWSTPENFDNVHAHPPVATGFATAGRPLNLALLPEVIIGLGCVPLAEGSLFQLKNADDTYQRMAADIVEKTDAIASGEIVPGFHYLVAGAGGAVQYNSANYAVGEKFTGVNGVFNYTVTLGNPFVKPYQAVEVSRITGRGRIVRSEL